MKERGKKKNEGEGEGENSILVSNRDFLLSVIKIV